jgi:hypothetical protein
MSRSSCASDTRQLEGGYALHFFDMCNENNPRIGSAFAINLETGALMRESVRYSAGWRLWTPRSTG